MGESQGLDKDYSIWGATGQSAVVLLCLNPERCTNKMCENKREKQNGVEKQGGRGQMRKKSGSLTMYTSANI